jgi:hypothetical protein
MFSSFYTTITINDEDVDVLVEYRATKCFGDVDVELISVTLDGNEIETTAEQDKAFIQECFDRVDDDYEDEQASYGDYRYDMSRE